MLKRLNINESFICRIWEGGNSYYSSLKTTNGDEVEVLNFGNVNHDSGPDYRNARIKIAGKTLVGDIEIHRDFKGWDEHSHRKDTAYNSVILQVVLWNTGFKAPKLRKKRNLPTVILSNFLNSSINEIWQEIISKPAEKFRLYCYDKKLNIDRPAAVSYLNRLGNQRLHMKAKRIQDRLAELSGIRNSVNINRNALKKKSIWEQVFFEFVFEALGYSKNKEPMMKLASNMDLKNISKLSEDGGPVIVESLLFGASGLMFDLRKRDLYIDQIKSYWNSVKEKYSGPVMNNAEWKFFRMRPQNFPTIRIAYGAGLAENILNGELIKKIIEQFNTPNFEPGICNKNVTGFLKPAENDYWQSHYNFGKESSRKIVLLGKQRVNDIIANVIIPYVYLYGNVFGINLIRRNAVSLFAGLDAPSDNSVIKIMHEQLSAQFGLKSETVMHQQALIHLYNFYCTRQRCAECMIGKSIKKVEEQSGYDYRVIFY